MIRAAPLAGAVVGTGAGVAVAVYAAVSVGVVAGAMAGAGSGLVAGFALGTVVGVAVRAGLAAVVSLRSVTVPGPRLRESVTTRLRRACSVGCRASTASARGVVAVVVDHVLASAVDRLPETDRDRWAEEWNDHRLMHDHVFGLLWWAICLRASAARLAAALEVAVVRDEE